jgi:hypothetical protein
VDMLVSYFGNYLLLLGWAILVWVSWYWAREHREAKRRRGRARLRRHHSTVVGGLPTEPPTANHLVVLADTSSTAYRITRMARRPNL